MALQRNRVRLDVIESHHRSYRTFLVALRLSAAVAALMPPLPGQMPQFSINPMRQEVEVSPGGEKTTAFEIEGAPSLTPERGRLILSVTDWKILEDGALTFTKRGSERDSASSWIIFNPSAFTLEADRTQLVRITVRAPETAKPGVYRTALFIEERPPAALPPPGTRVVFARGRYAFTLYVIIPPVSPKPELVDADIDSATAPPHLICQMENTGSRHVRPVVRWVIRHVSAIEAHGTVDATVLLPGARMREAYSLGNLKLAPGKYELSVVVDFQDGSPLQSTTRAFAVAEPAPRPPAVE